MDHETAQNIAREATSVDVESRDSFVQSRCGDDKELLDSVRKILDSLCPTEIGQSPQLQHGELPAHQPRKIAHFTIRRVIGTGGMGTVYEGVQDNPRRKVAIKVMRTGVTSRSAQRRFEFESQVLARLHHQCIAQIYEAGTWDDGSGGVPWFAMEYIAGARTLIDYANEKSLGTRERLNIFNKVCDAISHGHQKGIIHRDLKPGNILVDANGQPKVIDFGVARATDSDMAVTTLQTDVGQLLGTVQYMSPEQCEADPDILDTRSDVYTLGVILYELLCDALPYDLANVPVFEAVRQIREETPSRPSTIDRTLRGDAETIVLKAMHKDREQRYQSAHELQRDIQRYLDNEPIHARPPSIAYQMKVFARRNRGLFVSTIVVAAVLIAATAVSITLAVHATRSADEARAAEARVLKEQKNLRATSGYLIHVLAIPTPSVAQGRVMTPQLQLIEAGSDIDMWFESMPERGADQHALIGYFMVKMGMYDEAEEHLIPALPKIETEFGRNHWKTQFVLMTIAKLRDGQGNMEEADELSAAVETTIRNIARVDGAWTSFGIEMMFYRLELLSSMFRWDDAVTLAEELLEYLDGVEFNKATDGFSYKEMELAIKGQLGRNLLMLSSIQQEESVKSEMFEQSHDLLAEVVDTGPTIRGVGPRHPVVADARAKLAICQWGSGLGTKQAAIDAVHEIGIVYGPNHRRTLANQLNIGNLLYQKQEFTESEESLRSAVATLQQQLRPDDILLQTANVYLGRTLARVDKVDEAEPLLRNASRSLSEQLPPDHLHRIMARGLYGMCLQSQGRFEEAAPYHEEFISSLEELWGQGNREAIQIRFLSILRYFEHGQHDEALRKMRAFLTHCQSVLGEGHPIYLKFQTEHGDMLRDMGRHEQALKVFEQSYADAMQYLPVGDSRSWARPARNSAEADLQVARAYLGDLDGALAVNDQIIAYALQEDVFDGVERVVWAIGWRLKFLQETDRQGEVDQLFDQLVQQWWDDAASLNEAAWALGNDEDTSLHSERYAEQMLKIAERACELTDHENPMYLDTLAFVHYGRGEVPMAIRIQEQAVELAPEDELESYQEALERYRNAPPKAAE